MAGVALGSTPTDIFSIGPSAGFGGPGNDGSGIERGGDGGLDPITTPIRASSVEATVRTAAPTATASGSSSSVLPSSTVAVFHSQVNSPAVSGGNGSGVGHGGLSTGAIAGIAVACAVVGVLVLSGLAWFIVFRRRHGKHLDGGHSGQKVTGPFIAAKEEEGEEEEEEEAQARVIDSPLAPAYRDDDHHASTTIAAPVPRVSSMIDESAPAPAPAPGSSGVDGAETAQGVVSRNIAYLIEEGMTEDEIRRLEIEERQLDDEIERSARAT